MLGKLKHKLVHTRTTFEEKFDELLKSGKSREEILDQLTETLILADVGIHTTEKIIHSLREKSKKGDSIPQLQKLLYQEIYNILSPHSSSPNINHSPAVLMAVGVNGGGKTTSLAKLGYHYQMEGKSLMMVAADTFRAAAQEQLSLWGHKLNIPVIKGQYGADPASVIYDALHSFKSRNYDLLLVDTAGRIHTNVNLMNELEKIRRVTSKEISGAPHEVLLILDASIGQNALVQAKEFLKFSGLTGIFLTKLDGTAKGGSVISIADELKLPIKFIGVGEEEKDMMRFDPKEFANALLS